MKIYEIGTGYTSIPAQIAAATESVVEELSKAFLKLSESVEIIDIAEADRKPISVPVKEVKIPCILNRKNVNLGLFHKLKRVAYSVSLAVKLKGILKSEKAILHFHNQYNLFFFLKIVPKKLRKNAVVAYTNHNGLWSLPWDEVRETLSKRYFQEITAMKNADIIFVLNEKSKKNIADNLNISSERLFLITNGVNTEVYSPIEEKQVLELKAKYNLEGKTVILQVGSIYENKGQTRAVEHLAPLLKQHDNLVYAYAGEVVSEEYHNELKTKISDLALNNKVFYLGAFSPGEEMNKLYNIADATIFVSRYEGFPLVCIESLAAGVPVIAKKTHTLALPEACRAFSSQKELQDIVSDILGDGWQQAKKDARTFAKDRYDWAIIAKEHIDIFRKFEG